jgi:hypothetical protein
MAKTTIPGGYIQDNSVGIDALNVTDGTNGQYLQTDGSGTLSFASATVSDISDLTATATELNYLDGVTGITLGSANELLVVGGDGSSIVSDSTLAVDTSNNRLGINQSSPEVTLHMTGEGAQTAQIRMEQYNDSADAPDLRTRRYRGTIASPSAISSGDYLYRSNHEYWNGSALIVGGTFAFDNTNNANRTQFAVSVTTDGTSADANTPSKTQFKIDGNDSGAITFNNAYKFPTSDGSANQVLTTDGSGTLSFADSAGGVDGIVSSANATAITIDSNENVAIGSSTANKLFNLADPTQGGETLKLHFEADSASDKWIIYAYDRTNSHYADMSFGQNAIAIKGSNSNVGIGTDSPSGEFHVDSGLAPCDIHFTTGSTGGTGYDVNLNMTGGANNSEMNLNMGIAGDADREQIKTYQSDMTFRTNNTERLIIKSDGNMHLGSADSDVLMYIGSAGGAFGGNSSNHMRGSSSNLMFNTPGQFIVEKSGSLGILMDTDRSFYVRPATTSDNFGFYVRTANSADTGIKIGRTGTNNAEMGIKVSSNSSNSFASFKFAISDGTSWSSDDWFKLKVSGEMDGNFNDTSDQNLKENIVSIPNGDLAKVMQLNPVTFDWKNEVSRNDQTGFIAQEVETIFPNEVLGDAYDVEVEGSGKSINTIGLLSHTVKALQELKTIVDTLEARIETLENP